MTYYEIIKLPKQHNYIWSEGGFKKSILVGGCCSSNPSAQGPCPSRTPTFVPACRKCLEMDGELDECPNCAHEPALTKGKRYYCPRCVKNHKNPRDCGDCTTV